MPEFIPLSSLSKSLRPTVGKITRIKKPLTERHNYILIKTDMDEDLEGYAAILIQNSHQSLSDAIPWGLSTHTLDLWGEEDIVQIIPPNRRAFTVYKKSFRANSLYVTDLCNSHCIMCPQPPKSENSVSLEFLHRVIDLLPEDVSELGITGGEPTLLKADLVDLLKKLAEKSIDCKIHILTNARLLRNRYFVNQIFDCKNKYLSFGIPIYSCDPSLHDYIVQSKGAFNESIEGILNLARFNFQIEIRIVLQKQTIPGLLELAKWIYSNIPFVSHIAFMGMENMGYVKKNWDQLWIHPLEYQEELEQSIQYLHLRGLNVSIYNLPPCLLKHSLRRFARNSISDYKISYTQECETCSERNNCGGLFYFQKDMMRICPI